MAGTAVAAPTPESMSVATFGPLICGFAVPDELAAWAGVAGPGEPVDVTGSEKLDPLPSTPDAATDGVSIGD